MKKSLGLFSMLVLTCFFSLCVWAQEADPQGAGSILSNKNEDSDLSLVSSPGQTGRSAADVRITEYMYTGAGNEFFELTNMDSQAVDMTGWSYDDESANPGSVDLTNLGIVAPGESVILTTDDESDFIDDWALTNIKVLHYYGHYLSTNDQINIYSSTNQLVDCLTYGPDDFPGSVRSNGHSAFPVTADIGTDNIYRWLLSRDGDVQNSYVSANGDIGNPGIVEYILAQKDIGYGGPGEGQFWIYGPEIATGNRVDVLLRRASKSQPAFLFLGMQNDPTSVLGGTVVPVPPAVTLVMVTTPSDRCHYGEIYFTTDCGGGPTNVFAQFVYVDPAQCLGYGFSNALELDIGP